MSDKPLEPPSPVAIARVLTGLTTALAPDSNYERGCLEDVHRWLSEDPPDVDKARTGLAEGVAHAFRQHWREDKRPEAWLLAACAQLLAAS